MIEKVTVTAIVVVTLSLGNALAADTPVANGRGPALQFQLVDGSVIIGRIDAKVITFRVPSGSVLKIPVADVTILSVGLNDRPVFAQRVEALIEALDSGKTRQNALRELIALDPAVAPIIKRHAASDVSARRLAVAEVLKAYEDWRSRYTLSIATEAMIEPLEPQSTVWAGGNIFTGTIAVKQFRIASPYGTVTVKLDEVRWIRRASLDVPSKLLRWWDVELRDKTHIKCMLISPSLRIQTRYGTMVVPFAQITNAAIASDGKGIRVECRDRTRIAGELGASATISLKTDKGRADLSMGKITVVANGPITLKGRSSGFVVSVAFSPDGKRLASGCDNGPARLWDTATGKELLTFKGGHSHGVSSVAFSPDGKRLAVGDNDKIINIWDAAAGKGLVTLKGHSGPVYSVAFSPDGKRLASGGYGEIIKLWDAASGKELLVIDGHQTDRSHSNRWEYSVAFSPDGKRLASGSRSKTFKLWDTVTGKRLLTFKGHSRGVASVAFSPDGKRLASGSGDRTVRLWDSVTGKELLTLKGHLRQVLSVAFSPDGKRLASGSLDRTVKLWDSVTGKELLTFKGHSHGVLSVAFSPDGRRLASGSRDNTIKIWDVLDGTKPPK